jgi:hypothetical protein
MEHWEDVQAKNIVARTAIAITDAIHPEAMFKESSQLSLVALDLAKSACEAAGIGGDARIRDEKFKADFIQEQAERIWEIVSPIPAAFHHVSLPTIDGAPAAPFDLDPGEFLKAIPAIKDEPARKLKKAYGTLWEHSSAVSELIAGQKAPQHAEQYMHPCAEILDGIAGDYLKTRDLVSPTLEWALIDALIHSRILEFAYSRKQLGLLEGIPGGQAIDGAQFAETDGNPGEKNQETNLQLLLDMGIAHERVPGMNVKLLLHLLYRLEERGAGFSVHVYDILDRRAKREALS